MRMPPSEPTQVKLKILQAAKKLFAAKGYDGTSVREICEEAGVNIALISYHFGGKESVFAALFDHFFPSDKVQELADRLTDPVKGLQIFIVELTRYRYKDSEMMMILQQEVALRSPRIGIIKQHAFPMWRLLIDLLQRGREQGAFWFESVDHTFLSLLGSLLFHRQSDYFRPLAVEDPLTFEQSARLSVRFTMNALGAPDHAELDESLLAEWTD
ncbi:TetR/AcrR family transcriptional regulator [Paenibacillus thermoaerophilus]|nr:TetR/AcrR family transcriptional regulator [Paenibacillus thermoaerophilus]